MLSGCGVTVFVTHYAVSEIMRLSLAMEVRVLFAMEVRTYEYLDRPRAKSRQITGIDDRTRFIRSLIYARLEESGDFRALDYA